MKRKLCFSDNENPNKKAKKEHSLVELWSQFTLAKNEKQHKNAVEIFSQIYQRGYFKTHLSLNDAHCSLPIKKSDHLLSNSQEHYLTGLQYILGLGVEINYEEALGHILYAAEQEHPGAQCLLGLCYKTIDGIQDYKQSSYWLKKAAQQGHADAQCNLGHAFTNGIGVNLDLKEAFEWFKKAAEQGHAEAQYLLGDSFQSGKGISVDLIEAFEWYKRSAKQGDVNAQLCLGYLFRTGHGVTQDLTKAVFWLRKADEEGGENALTELQEIGTPLAAYTIAWLEDNHEELIKIILANQEIEQEFFKEDFTMHTWRESEVSNFINFVQQQAKLLNKDLTSFFVNWLINLDLKTRQQGIARSESSALLLTSLINEIEWSEVKREHIDSLMYFFCLQYIENKTYIGAEVSCFIEPLLKLWYKGQSFNHVSNDPGMKRLFACVLINHYFHGQYELPCSVEINVEILTLLVCSFENKSMDVFEPMLLVQSLNLIETKTIFSELLRLKTCLTFLNEENNLFFSLIRKILNVLEVQVDNNLLGNTVFADMSKAASEALAFIPSFFSASLNPQERQLAILLSAKDVANLSHWIDEMNATQQQISLS